MDIHTWLHNTVYGAAPDSSQRMPLLPTEADADHHQLLRKNHRKRKRITVDSSLVAPSRTRRKPRGKRHKQLSPPDRGLSSDYGKLSLNYDSGQDLSPEPTTTTLKRRNTQQAPRPFQRQPRRKTRPDKYEPKRTKCDAERKGHKERDRHTKRRGLRQAADGSRTVGLVQSFQTKNRPRANRLTLRPDGNAGLFKHGRASMQISGAAPGLPDLVFNEMKFLQLPREHQSQDPNAAELSSTRHRKGQRDGILKCFDQHKVQEENVASFPGNLRGTASTHQSIGTRGRRAVVTGGGPQAAETSQEPPLGNGDGLPSSKPGTNNDNATTYFSWSKSVDSRTASKGHQLKRLAQKDAPIHIISDPDDGHTERTSNNQKRTLNVACLDNKHCEGNTKIHQEHQVGRDVGVSDPSHNIVTTSQSLPHLYEHQMESLASQYPSSPPRSSKYRTSDILKARNIGTVNDARRHTLEQGSMPTNEPSSWSRLFQQARSAMEEGLPLLNMRLTPTPEPYMEVVNEAGYNHATEQLQSLDVFAPDAHAPRSPCQFPDPLKERRLSAAQAHDIQQDQEPLSGYRGFNEPHPPSYASISGWATPFQMRSEAVLLQPHEPFERTDDAHGGLMQDRYAESRSRRSSLGTGNNKLYEGRGNVVTPLLSASRRTTPSSNGIVFAQAVRVGSSYSMEWHGTLQRYMRLGANPRSAQEEVDFLEPESFWKPQTLC